jgi:hypothetical protein
MKTLIGKNGYLFLQNDSCKEIEVHNNNLCLVDLQFYKRYETILDKFLFIVIPNKSLIYAEHLPDIYNLQYRPGFDLYSNYFKHHLIDMFPSLVNLDTYYKTDTHINIKGALIIYNNFIDKINNLFGLTIVKQEYTLNAIECKSLCELCIGIGDLTWSSNLGNQPLSSTYDVFYTINNAEQLYCKYIFRFISIFFQFSKIKIILVIYWKKISIRFITCYKCERLELVFQNKILGIFQI